MKTAIEIGNEILALPKEKLALEDSKGLIMCVLHEMQNADIPEDISKVIQYKIIESRIKAGKVPVSPWVIAFLGMITITPGECVLYSAALAAIHAKKPDQTVTLHDLTWLDAFALGFPNRTQLEIVWDGQKIHDGNGPDNMLDRIDCWQPKKESV